MATLRIPWNDGNGNIILSCSGGQGNATVTVTTDTDNLGDDRSQVITLTTTGSNPATARITVTQPTGMLTLRVDGVELRTTDGRTLRVPPVTT